jgi:hypothetical protein
MLEVFRAFGQLMLSGGAHSPPFERTWWPPSNIIGTRWASLSRICTERGHGGLMSKNRNVPEFDDMTKSATSSGSRNGCCAS